MPQVSDQQWMHLAFQQAELARGLTSPNPPVGAVLVKDGRLLAVGHHQEAGGPHAEVAALAQAGPEARGSTLYITLEPCSTHGRTPPCTQAILNAGITRVVYATSDPNPEHAGHADSVLQEAGLEVTPNLYPEEGLDLIRFFAHWITNKQPYLIAKWAMTLDGKLTRPAHEKNPHISSEAARMDAQLLREEVDAILIGSGTLQADNPQLTLRRPGRDPRKPQPWRIVLSKNPDALPRDHHLFQDEHQARTLILDPSQGWPNLLDQMAARDITSVLLEGGAHTLSSALEAGVVQEIVTYTAPVLSGAGLNVTTPEIFNNTFTSKDLKVKSLHIIDQNQVRLQATL